MSREETKAKELIDKFYDKAEDFPVLCGMYCQGGYIDKIGLAKQCALICVDEILKEANGDGFSWCINVYWLTDKFIPSKQWKQFWMDVKEEIQKL